MASFVVHHVAGVIFLKQLEKKYHITLTENQKNQFLLGNLIVDSSNLNFNIPENVSLERLHIMKKEYFEKQQKEKISTHFRNINNLCVQAPIIQKFIEKYNELIKTDMTVFGYLFHLYTDKRFFDDFFNESFEYLDENMEKTIYKSSLKYIRVKKNGNIYLASDVFSKISNVSIYDDYTVMNKLILNYYDIEFPFLSLYDFSQENFINPGIEEVNYENIFEILRKTKVYIEQSYNIESDKLNPTL